MDNVTHTKGRVEGKGELIIEGNLYLAAQVGQMVVYTGIDVIINGQLVIAEGQNRFESLIVSGKCLVRDGAFFALQGVEWGKAKIQSSGRFIVDGVLALRDTCSFEGESSGSIENNGLITIQNGRLSLQGNTNIEGRWTVSVGKFFEEFLTLRWHSYFRG